jgi:hypothetical protein
MADGVAINNGTPLISNRDGSPQFQIRTSNMGTNRVERKRIKSAYSSKIWSRYRNQRTERNNDPMQNTIALKQNLISKENRIPNDYFKSM